MKKLNGRTIVLQLFLVKNESGVKPGAGVNIGPTIRITISATPIYLASLSGLDRW